MRRRESTYPPVCPPANAQSSPSFGDDSPVGFTKARRNLANHHRRFLSTRAIDQEVARERGYWSIETEASARGLGYRGQNARLGLAIPIHTVWGREWAGRWTQLRPDDPLSDEKGKVRKYLRPAKSETVIDVHPRSLDLLRDRSVPVVITEGIPKADALTSLGFISLGLLGVNCWSGNDGTVLPDLKNIALKERQAIIAFDSDARTNPHVLAAARRLGDELKRRGADVYLALPPAPADGKLGWDDHLATLDPPERTQRVILEAAEPIDAAVPKLRPRLEAILASDVREEAVDYLVEPTFPLGKLVLVEGDAGVGKTYFLLFLGAALTSGGAIPSPLDGAFTRVREGAMLYITLEDGVADTIVPRFRQMGGRVERLVVSRGFVEAGGKRRTLSLSDLDPLEDLIREHRPLVVVLDPVLGFFGSSVDIHRANETRVLLSGLVELAERHGLTVVGIRHTAKEKGRRAIHAGLGTVDIAAAARSILNVGKHPTKAGVIGVGHVKSSTAALGLTHEYSIEADRGLVFLGVSTLTADDLATAPPRARGPRPEKRAAAVEWLRAELVAAGVAGLAAGDVYKRAARAGHDRKTVQRAAKQLPISRSGRARAVRWRTKF